MPPIRIEGCRACSPFTPAFSDTNADSIGSKDKCIRSCRADVTYRPLKASTEYAVAASFMNRPISESGSRCLFIEVLNHAPDGS